MIYALVHYPNIDILRINQFRKKYDPQFNLIAPHITVMFPVPESVGEEKLVRHLESVLCNWQPFSIRLQEVQISSDDYLYLLLQEGGVDVIRLHNEIYTGMLVDFLREDYPFIPHLTLGVLEQGSESNTLALEEAKGLGIDQRCVFDRVHLVKVNHDRSRIILSKEFPLAK
jgi:2'-5' RNA ligase